MAICARTCCGGSADLLLETQRNSVWIGWGEGDDGGYVGMEWGVEVSVVGEHWCVKRETKGFQL